MSHKLQVPPLRATDVIPSSATTTQLQNQKSPVTTRVRRKRSRRILLETVSRSRIRCRLLVLLKRTWRVRLRTKSPTGATETT